MTESQLSRLLQSASAEPIAPEYDPVWEQASMLLKSSSMPADEDAEAVARTVRAVKMDAYSRQARHWIPVAVAVVASALAFFALAEAVVPHPLPTAPVVEVRR